MIQLSLEAVSIKKKEKRTLITFFFKEKPHRLKLTKRYISNPRGCFYKKKKEREMEERERERGKEGREREKGKKERKEGKERGRKRVKKKNKKKLKKKENK